MNATLDRNAALERLQETQELAELDQSNKVQFEPYEEEAIVSLALDHPEFFSSAARFMKVGMFARPECQLVIQEILDSFNQHHTIPTRKLLHSRLEKTVTEDQPYEEIFRIVDRPSDIREVPLIKDTVLKWSKERAFGLIYSSENIALYRNGEYAHLEEIIQEANRIADVGNVGMWFFEDFEKLFQPDIIQHKTTGFPRLDKLLNNGGPSAKECVCYLAATNVGKCHSSQTLIIEEKLSRIYELELENGQIVKLRGIREVQTTRGTIKVANLTDADCLTKIPIGDDTWDLEL